MCGLVVLADTTGAGVDLVELYRATTALSHRGPDDVAFAVFPADGGPPLVVTDSRAGSAAGLRRAAGPKSYLALGFRRLSIIDPTPGGRQPMASPDGRHWLVFNGELYNYLELRRQFGPGNGPAASRSDTEVLAQLLAARGRRGLDYAVGMFGLAFIDLHERSLLLARDPFGIKPLFYTARDGRLAAASELPALLECQWVERRLDPAGARDFLAVPVTDHRESTLLVGVHQVRPGQAITIGLTGALPVLENVHYRPVGRPRRAALSFPEAVEQVREALLRSVELHMRSDTEVALTLSGGLDSSAIAAATRHVLGDALELNTFGYVPARGSAQHEGRWMKIAVHGIKARHTMVRIDLRSLPEDLNHLVAAQGEPLTSPAPVAQMLLYRAIRKHGFKVALDGQGADELFGGYTAALSARLAALLRRGRLAEAARFARALGAQTGSSEVRPTLRKALALLAASYGPHRALRSAPAPYSRAGWWEPRAGPEIPPVSLETGDILRTADRNAMASSVENRVPFLTGSLADLALSLADEHLVAPDGTRKHVLREAMSGLVPDELLARRGKTGFASVEPGWMPAVMGWMREAMRSQGAESLPFLDRPMWQQAWADAEAQAARGVTPANLDALWRWASLNRWISDLNVTVED
jgi:asparagine synthase (glutamine-hydrolysing)